MDWNTFLSTLSQSAAGLIAIVAAFVISKLLGENEKQETYDSQVSKLIIDYNDLIQRISIRKFTWYDRRNIEYSTDVIEAVKNNEFSNLADNEKLNLLFLLEPHLYKTDVCLDQLNLLIKKYAPQTNSLGMTFSSSMPLLAPNGLWDKIGKERELINQLQIDSFTLINNFKDVKSDFINTMNGLDSFKYTLYILAFGFFLTVVYPLHFMPMKLDISPEIDFSLKAFYSTAFSIKGLFLFFLSLVVVLIFGYFFLVIKRIKRKYLILEKELSAIYFDIKSYCRYF
ncbi:hypothetical protein [Flavobacterium bizetiae]|uniref:hypothetical protein n=1 Tax=Flavobacterium bizetiae TaxID=2704140 RepID=UPI00174AEF5A|nr:hypothetical protein [Flavobacterium bizetiae]CAD5349585.1 hypothetical protein FLA105534_03571 [Flavobacterium bizetiae]